MQYASLKRQSENLEGRGYIYVGVDGIIILKSILRKYFFKMWTGFTWLRIGTPG
jgi:hypothetical protein